MRRGTSALALAAGVGGLLWLHAARTTEDPYDGGAFWSWSPVTSLLLGALAGRREWAGFAGAIHVVYPIYWTLTETGDSPFGPLGIVFLVPFAGVLALLGFLGAWSAAKLLRATGRS